MSRPQVTCSVEKGVMTIRIDNPELDNGLTWEGLNQFADCYEKLRGFRKPWRKRSYKHRSP